MRKYLNYILLLMISLASVACVPGCTGDNNGKEGDEPWEWNKKPGGNEGTENNDTVYYPKAEGCIRIVSYNVGAFSKYMKSTDMVAAMMKEIEADVVGLNEVDSCNTRNNVNQAKALADAMGGWQWRYARAMAYREGAYGNAIVVPKNVKILDSYTVALPKGTGSEPRSVAVIETPDYILGAAHLDHTSEESVMSQINVVNAWAESLDETKRPVFFCGDMNSRPDSAPITLLKTKWNMLSSTENTIPSNAPTSCIDFVFHLKTSAKVTCKGGHTMTKFHNGDASKASDHLPIYVDVQF